MTAEELAALIPQEAVESAAKTAWEAKYNLSWILDCPEQQKQKWRKRIRAACAAMLESWPGMETRVEDCYTPPDTILILPLPEVKP